MEGRPSIYGVSRVARVERSGRSFKKEVREAMRFPPVLASIRPVLALLTSLLLGSQDSPPRNETGALTGVVVYEGVPPRPDLIEPFGEEGATLNESLLVTKSGELVNVVAFVEVSGAPKWKREKAQIMIANNRAFPRIVFVSPGAEVELKNGHDFRASFVSDFGAFSIPPGGSLRHTLKGPGLEPPMRWYSG